MLRCPTDGTFGRQPVDRIPLSTRSTINSLRYLQMRPERHRRDGERFQGQGSAPDQQRSCHGEKSRRPAFSAVLLFAHLPLLLTDADAKLLRQQFLTIFESDSIRAEPRSGSLLSGVQRISFGGLTQRPSVLPGERSTPQYSPDALNRRATAIVILSWAVGSFMARDVGAGDYSRPSAWPSSCSFCYVVLILETSRGRTAIPMAVFIGSTWLRRSARLHFCPRHFDPNLYLGTREPWGG